MRIGLRLKLFLISLALIAVSVALADVYVTRSVTAHVTAMIRDDLVVRARLLAREASASALPLTDIAAWDALADAEGSAADARVTLIRRDGTVLGDSAVDTPHVAGLENHLGRPEVTEALAVGRGEWTRPSTTVHLRTMYAAIPFERNGAVAGIARIAKPLREVDDATGAVRRLILLGSGAALAIAMLMSSLAADRMSRVVENLTDVARRMTEGDLSARTRVTGRDELAVLGRRLDALAGSLSTTLGELTAERDLLGRILEGMQEGVLVLDKDGRVVIVNSALRAMLLIGAAAIGKLLIEVARDTSLHELLKEARSTHTVIRGEIDLPGLKPRRLMVHVVPLAGDDDRVLAVFVDVTELRRLESLRRDFVANVSHELRTPVAAVRSAAETLQTGALDDPEAAMRFVEMIDRNAQRLQSLIEDLLELSRLESKQFRLKRERIDLGAVVPLVLGLFRQRAEQKGVRLRADLPSVLPVLDSDARAVEQVLSNLVENAVKYCPSGSDIVVSVGEEDGSVRVRVTDSGPGIDASHTTRIFERFYRVDAGRSRALGGTGLGLSIVKHLAEAMGGTVSVTSELGKGSSFIMTLPAAGS